MHLARIDFLNFRSCRSSSIELRPDLTVLIGENNAGKSNAIDAIRLLTNTADGRRNRFCEPADLTFGSDESSFSLRATYEGLSDAEQAIMLAASDGIDTAAISHRLTFQLPGAGQRRGRSAWTVGENDAIDPEPAARERIRHVFLPPLRDAEQALGSAAGDRIEFVLRSLADDDDLDTLEDAAQSAESGLRTHPLLARLDHNVRAELSTVTTGSIPHTSELSFVETDLRRLARSLRMKLAEHGLDPADLSHSGLGYANLLYLATVVVELAATRDADLTLFLVEEPEAHLHPQLQVAVLDFLRGSLDRDDVAGSVQVVISTHSPLLASAVPSKHLAVLKHSTNRTPPEEDGPTPTPETAAVPVWQLAIPEPQHRKVDRYLDATRSAMLFGPRVMLVEGLAEAILIPALAKRELTDPDDLARFRAATIVAIGGVDFEPYLRILLTRYRNECIAHRVHVVTDEDPTTPGDRRAALTSIAETLGSAEQLSIAVAPITLEAALVAAGNETVMRDAFIALHPRSANEWENYVSDLPPNERPAGAVQLFSDKSVRKGDFAQTVAGLLDPTNTAPDEEEKPPTVAWTTPQYLLDAIRELAQR